MLNAAPRGVQDQQCNVKRRLDHGRNCSAVEGSRALDNAKAKVKTLKEKNKNLEEKNQRIYDRLKKTEADKKKPAAAGSSVNVAVSDDADVFLLKTAPGKEILPELVEDSPSDLSEEEAQDFSPPPSLLMEHQV